MAVALRIMCFRVWRTDDSERNQQLFQIPLISLRIRAEAEDGTFLCLEETMEPPWKMATLARGRDHPWLALRT